MSEHPIQHAIEETRDCLLDSFDSKPAFLATHFSFGALGMPGYVIKSAAKAADCNFATWAKNDRRILEDDLHAKVIVQHARQFQRGITVPALLAKLAKKHDKPVFLTLSVHDNDSPLELEVQEHGDGWHRLSIKLSEKLATALCPPSLPENYLKRLYEDSKVNRRSELLTEGDLRPFDLPRYEAFGILISDPTNLESTISSLIVDGEEEIKSKAWSLLGTLQSALLYFRGSQKPGNDTGTSGFAFAFPLTSIQQDDATPFGFALGGPNVGINIHKARDCFTKKLWTKKVQTHVEGSDISKHLKALETAVSEVSGMTREHTDSLSNSLEREIRAIVPFEGPQNRLRLLGLWLIYLLSKLRGAKHEGKPVDFWLVAGEQSEFADDVDVRLEKHPLRITNNGAIAQDMEFERDKFKQSNEAGLSLNKEVCDLIARRLEKEHYPWFSLGRHSLFFDSSAEGLNPLGLAELRAGSWNRLVSESFKLPNEQELSIPGCLVAFVDGASGEAGLLVCQPKTKDGQKARVKRVLRHKGGKWHVASDERQGALESLLKTNVGWLGTGEDSKMISQMATMIADDPHAGGTLVFVSEKPKPNEFLRLGAPWEFDLFHQDRIPLISHDGATVVWKEGDKVMMSYRQLLTPEINDELKPVEEHLQARSLGNEPDFPLLGVGTRRWSAALSSLRSNVPLVVVISTDGDITCWWAKNEKKRELWYQSLPTDFNPASPKCAPKNVLA